MKIGTTIIDETFAEAFRMRYARLVVTASDEHWVNEAAREVTGYASSIIACDAEAGVERLLSPVVTPDGRAGVSILFFGFSADGLAEAVPLRCGQCLMTCATTAVFDGLPDAETRIPLGSHLRYFGDGFQKSKVVSGRRYWRLPVMDGEFLVEEDAGVEEGIAGGNIIIQATGAESGLEAARRAVDALRDVPGIITPFPGGVVRSGSKVGSRYKALRASTNQAFCPTLRGRVETKLQPRAECAYEIVINGVNEEVVGDAMAVAMRAAAGPEVVAISAGNYGGTLGKFQFHLREVLK
ncbi:MAG: formylmethanofuran--tetrahydromethanopterin N-formyltransferase [Planctomycetota bacterium]|nr:formylmethanofuran--tetrahydromethanopterin N-formyltransferase [Planctomycetota bacterium]